MKIQLRSIFSAICLGCLVFVGAPSVSAPTLHEAAKLLAEDGVAFDTFGFSVAVSGDMAVVGSRADDDNGIDSGAAYLFVRSGGVWDQQAKLLPSDGTAGELFGYSVAISDTSAVIGVYYDDNNSGSAYFYDLTDASGTLYETAKLLPSDAALNDAFGKFVAVSGTTAVIGAYNDDDNGEDSGSAYVFDLTAATGTLNEVAKLLPSDGAAAEIFGTSVAVSGATAVIGAQQDDDHGISSGAAYVFDLTAAIGTVNETAKLLASDAAAGDNFGEYVAVSGNTAVIGAFRDDDNGIDSGSAYVFDLSAASGTVNEVAKLLPSNGATGDQFGISVAVSGTTAVISDHRDNDNGSLSGAAYVFENILDDDGDGIVDNDDYCPSTAIPETVPTVRLLPSRWALIDNDSEFETVIKGKGNGPNRSYIIEDTAGCSCEQIIEVQGLGLGHTYHGCSISAMDEWVELVNP